MLPIRRLFRSSSALALAFACILPFSGFAASNPGGPQAAASALPEPDLPERGPASVSSATPGAAASPAALSAAALSAADAGDEDCGALETARRLKAKLSYDPLTGYGVFDRPELRASFALGVPWIVLDQDRSLRVEAPRPGKDGPVFPASTVVMLQKAFGAAEAAKPPHYTVAAIVIDPGHGGKDPGTTGEHIIHGKRLVVVEKNITLDVGLKVYAALKKRFPDRRILITRTGDTYPTLEQRVSMANSVELTDNEAVIYVSIHANASFNKTARGFEVWYLDPNYRRTLISSPSTKGSAHEIAPILNAMLEEEFTTESIILAKNISSGLQSQIGNDSPNRGIRPEEWFVVRNARMPAVLVETGFVTNPDEAVLLSREDYLRRVADGIYNGIVDFVAYFESMKGAPPR
ncbi:MAG TPA: N-acetylmuramoyl-L-alanine amidase [Rectinemataceae bacterium]|nr:N-acetylmuramoyl-L-alanine amidase [Rectinemataceae bacterium]